MGLEPPKPKVRASGGVVLWREAPCGHEVYWVERSKELAFMGGFHAFPGGGRSRTDKDLRVRGEPRGLDGASAEAGMPDGVLDGVDLEPIAAPGIVGCVVRELFEETGILLAEGVESLDAAQLERARRDSLARGASFGDVVAGLGVELDASELVYAGRWLTPPMGPVRFDNRFFLLEWPADRPHPRQPFRWLGRWKSGGGCCT